MIIVITIGWALTILTDTGASRLEGNNITHQKVYANVRNCQFD